MTDSYWAAESSVGTGIGNDAANPVALSSLHTPLGWGLAAAGDTIYIMRNEDDSPIEVSMFAGIDLGLSNSGSSTAPFIITGCDHEGNIDGKKTKIKIVTSAISYLFNVGLTCDYVRFQHLEVDCDDLCDIVINQSGGATAGEYPTAYNIHGTNGKRCVSFRGKGAKISNCYAKDMTDYGYVLTGNGSQVMTNCVAIDCSGAGQSNFYLADTAYMINCYSGGGSGPAVKVAGDNAAVINCTLNDSPLSGILSDHHGFVSFNNIISNNGAYGIDDNGADDLNISDYNLYYSNTSGNRLDMGKGFHDIDDLNPLFTDIANHDASVGSNSPAWRAGTNNDTIGYTRRPHGVIMGGYEHLS